MRVKHTKKQDARLATVAEFVRKGAVLADVGSDHAYLPIALVQAGHIQSAIASDIHKGPVENARANIAQAGLANRITVVCCDGVAPLESYNPTDIVIAGMGGMLIVEILQSASFLKKDGIRLVLQPMRDVSAVRTYLAANGFLLVDEALCKADGKLYQVLVAEYTGQPYTLTEVETAVGPHILKKTESIYYTEHLQKIIKPLTVRIAGLQSAGQETATLEAQLRKLQNCLANGDLHEGT